MIKKAYKYRLHPNKTQEQKLNQTFGCTRLVWNNCVYMFNNHSNIKSIPELKTEYEFLKDVSAATLQQKQRDFVEFKKQFFSKNRKKKINKPRFKKKGVNDSFRLPNQKFKLIDNKIQLEKIGKIKIVIDRLIPENAKLLSVTVSRNSCGQYFASVLVEQETIKLKKTNKSIGCDLGIKSFLVTNDEVFENPKYFRESQAKLKKAQQKLSKKQKGSNRYNKFKLRVAKIHNKVKNQRSHYIHQITNKLVTNYDVISIEDLNVSGMIKNKKLSKSISDASFSIFKNQLTYKCNWYGKELFVVDRFFASSKTCSNCGAIKKDLKLKDRIYKCGECGLQIDRDLNAAINLKNKAIGVNVAQRTQSNSKTSSEANCNEVSKMN